MEITHSYLRMAVGAVLAAGLASACSGGGSSGTTMAPTEPMEPEPPAPVVGTVTTDVPAGCMEMADAATCTVTRVTTAADGTMTTEVTITTNVPNAAENENTRTVTVDGAMRTITVMDTANDNRPKSVERQACAAGVNCVRTWIDNYVYNAEGMATVTRTSPDPAVMGGTIETRSFSGGEGDKLMDMIMKVRAAPAEGATLGALTDDLVINPGVQDHAVVSGEQYAMIQTGLTPRANSKVLMGRAALHLDYDDDDAFNSWHANLGGSGDTADLNVEFATQNPDCSAGGSCEYSRLRGGPGMSLPTRRGEIHLYENPAGVASGDDATPVLTSSGSPRYDGAAGSFIDIFASDTGGWANGSRRLATQGVLLQVLSDLLDVGGAGVSSAYTATDAGNVAALRADANAAAPTNDIDPTYKFVVTPAAEMNPMDRNTYTYLRTAELPDGVTGIGRQVRQVDSYLRLGGVRGVAADPDATPPVTAVEENKVSVQVENYFGWMENSMFTVRRVTAENADYEWFGADATFEADPADRVRLLVGMASGDPSDRPEIRREAGMTDPGTWTGSMIGVGSIQGERYTGDALVSVRFSDNRVNTQFKRVQLDRGGLSDAEFGRFSTLSNNLASDLTDADGITFRSAAGITDAGAFTSTDLRGASGESAWASNLQGQFYGPDAAEVAGTFTAYGLAVGGRADDADLSGDLSRNRGDIVGAFGAARDAMVEAEDN